MGQAKQKNTAKTTKEPHKTSTSKKPIYISISSATIRFFTLSSATECQDPVNKHVYSATATEKI